MDRIIIDNINALVKPDDTLWHLGDFCFGPRNPQAFYRKAEYYRDRINCNNIMLIWGNHDPDLYSYNKEYKDMAENFRRLFKSDYSLKTIMVENQKIVLCHYAMKVWNKSHYGVWHLYGHSHGSLPDDPNSLSFDCGVDCHNYRPISFPEVSAIMAKKTFKPVDHHGKRDDEN